MEKMNYFILVMQHEGNLTTYFSKLKWVGYLLYNAVPFYIVLMYLLAVIINILIVFYYQIGYSFSEPMYNVILLLGLVTVCLSGYVFFIFFLRNIPVIVKESKQKALNENPFKKWTWKNSISWVKQTIIGTIKDESFYYATFVLFSILGVLFNHLFFIYQLSFVLRIDLLRGAVSAVWIRGTQLILTLLLLIVIFYYFAIVAFQWFPRHVPHQRCNKLYECLITTFDL